MTVPDPRISPLGATAILTDTQIKLTFAPTRPEARVVGLQIEVNAMKMAQMSALMQQGAVHVQIKAGFAAERRLTFTPAEMVTLYDMLDKFITELPRVDDKAAKPTT